MNKQQRKEQKQREKDERQLRNILDWRDYLSEHRTILVFDTETSGLDPEYSDILSLSWQLIEFEGNHSWHIKQERTCYFEWVSDKRVSCRAIEVNGLTKERLAELGTIERADGIKEFGKALSQADLLVAHNGKFDKKFVKSLAFELHREFIMNDPEEGYLFMDIREDMNKPLYDTMKRMTTYCALPHCNGGYKWPRLSELAQCLKIDDSDIDYHQSAADVELTKRCFCAIIDAGLDCVPQN